MSRHWFSPTKKLSHASSAPLLGRIIRQKNLPLAPSILHLTSKVRIVGGQPGMRGTSEAVAMAIEDVQPQHILLADRPDSSFYLKAFNALDNDFEWDTQFSADIHSVEWQEKALLSPIPESVRDISLTSENLHTMAEGALAFDTVPALASTGKLVRWNQDSELYNEFMTAIVAASKDPFGCTVLAADIPTWAQIGFLIRTNNFTQLARLLHVASDNRFRQPAFRTPSAFSRMVQFSPLLGAIRAKYFANVLFSAVHNSNRSVVGVIPPSMLHAVRQAYSEIMYTRQNAESNPSNKLIQRTTKWITDRLRLSSNESHSALTHTTPLSELAYHATPTVNAPSSTTNSGQFEDLQLNNLIKSLTFTQNAINFAGSHEQARHDQTRSAFSRTNAIQLRNTAHVSASPLVVDDTADGTEDPVMNRVRKLAWISTVLHAPPPAGVAIDGPRFDWNAWWIKRGDNRPPPFFPDFPGSVMVNSTQSDPRTTSERNGNSDESSSLQEWRTTTQQTYTEVANEFKQHVSRIKPIQLDQGDPIGSFLTMQDKDADHISSFKTAYNYFQ